MLLGWRRVDVCAAFRIVRQCSRMFGLSSARPSTSEPESRKPAEVFSSSVTATTATARAMESAREHNIPVEKYSLSRGLALNKFEKDFLIFPEYTEIDAVTNIKLFALALQKELHASLKSAKGSVDDVLKTLFESNKIASWFVPQEYGGLGMCNKDLLMVSEVLGEEFGFYEVANQIHIATSLLLLYGTDEQKDRLLPKIASGELRPAICIHEESLGTDLLSMKSYSIAVESSCEKVSGKKASVIGARSPNLLFFFAKRKAVSVCTESLACYLLETERYQKGSVVTSPKNTLGLAGLNVCTVEVKDLSVNADQVLGGCSFGEGIASEVYNVRKITYGAAAAGFLRMLIGKLAQFCNSTIQHNARLSENRGIQKLMTDLALNTFVLESMTYYIGGFLDENLIIVTDIENAIVNKFANYALREAVATTTEIIGTKSCELGLDFERFFRDITTVLSLGNMNMDLTDLISMSTLTSWASNNAIDLAETRRFKKGVFSRMFGLSGVNMNNPKMVLFLAEHAHPALENACRNLEMSMSRINMTVGKVLENRGKGIEMDFAALCSLSAVIENNFAMLATISRATRSYSIGLRNSQLEIAWTQTFCAQAAESTLNELKALSDYFGLARVNPALLDIGCTVLDNGGYCIENPVERNW